MGASLRQSVGEEMTAILVHLSFIKSNAEDKQIFQYHLELIMDLYEPSEFVRHLMLIKGIVPPSVSNYSLIFQNRSILMYFSQ